MDFGEEDHRWIRVSIKLCLTNVDSSGYIQQHLQICVYTCVSIHVFVSCVLIAERA